ncbi:thiamine pyrophosphate-binding protein [Sphingomonas immobilis]|uniref:Thiamine pyrophosphate-binding protein n=1 Tax=Sphingomonas immobilis TaxID=3063997 RepID=A0ABT9A2D9_9SPHN|nr:thiamine pyrophosphate-binding protein [Sphingomonas sp. CA1-15]MDO7843999.1 thiamine pyrophosphate-binding protein [Sphingomonas sp. CA1-15]
MKHWTVSEALPQLLEAAAADPASLPLVVEPRIILDFDGVLFNSAFEAYSVCNVAVRGNAAFRQDVSFEEFMEARAFVTDAWQYNRVYSCKRHTGKYAALKTVKQAEDDTAFAKTFFAARAAMMLDPDWPKSMAPYDFFFQLRPLLLAHPERFAILSTRNVESIKRTFAFFGVPADLIPVFGQEHIREYGSKLQVAQAQGWLSGDRFTVYVDDMTDHLKPFEGKAHLPLHADWGYDRPRADSLAQAQMFGILQSLIERDEEEQTLKYSDQIGAWLQQAGYTHYFYVGGGNIMHLTESLDRYLTGVPVVHEVAAGIAAEYFNEIAAPAKALALVTTGPGLTNIVTAVSGAYLESRELLVIGGQVKTSDLAHGKVRSRGIQEVDGVALMASTTKASTRMLEPFSARDFLNAIAPSWEPRKGPVFLELPLDVQAATVTAEPLPAITPPGLPVAANKGIAEVAALYAAAERPIVLIGGGVDYATMADLRGRFADLRIPVMTTYNGADRIDGDDPCYLGRPNTWGQRSANIIIQKADLIIALGTRLGLQQTGFNWQEFGRAAKIVQVEIDPGELAKGHPRTDLRFCADANDFVRRLVAQPLPPKDTWRAEARRIRDAVPRVEDVNHTGEGYISPYDFIVRLEPLTRADDLIIPCSSGSAFTLSMQLYKQKYGQRILTNKSLASMGYGLSGAIGASVASGGKRRTILIEGDGGFSQNVQELGTVDVNQLDLKIFIFHDQGQASIRMTQQNYFDGKYLGCDRQSGLGLPKWTRLFAAWDIPVIELPLDFESDATFQAMMASGRPAAFIVPIDPKQTYFPKISSRVTASGSMESNPIDRMTPEIDYLAAR